MIDIIPDLSSLVYIIIYMFFVNKIIFLIMVISLVCISMYIKKHYKTMLDTQIIYTEHLHKANSFFYEKINNLYNIYINNSTFIRIHIFIIYYFVSNTLKH